LLSQSDRSISEVIHELAKFNIEAGYIVPTKTGIQKSIFDAHETFRIFLSSKKIHDYSRQPLGPINKKVLPVTLILEDLLVPLTMSLYRPKTKNGDPRIWVRGLKPHIKPGNLLAFFKVGKTIYVLNTSNKYVFKSTKRDLLKTSKKSKDKKLGKSSVLSQVMRPAASSLSSVEIELLGMLKEIEQRGWVPTISTNQKSTNDVGDTLEHLLGISRNSSKAPDYKGIEIKGSHKGPQMKKLTGKFDLFGLVPNWGISPIKSEAQLVHEFGYQSKKHGAMALQSTVLNKRNPQGLYLDYNAKQDWIENNKHSKLGKPTNIVNWKCSDLKKALGEKHDKTFWVIADKRINVKSGKKEFYYHTVIASSDPLLNNLTLLILDDTVSLEYVAKQEVDSSGKTMLTSRGPAKGYPKIRSHGINWKIRANKLSSLFPNNRAIDLKTYVP
jgi:hypothetical protein